MEKIDELKAPPIVGRKYLVPCIIRQKLKEEYKHELPDLEWIIGANGDLVPDSRSAKITYHLEKDIWPIINHLHHDKENGQDYYHYHVDYRFTILKDEEAIIPAKLHSMHSFAPTSRYNLLSESQFTLREDYTKGYVLEYYSLTCLRVQQAGITHPINVTRSVLNYDCIHKGKCPHRGYDLSQEVPVNGIITCPLHGLKFNAKTKKLLKTQ